MLVYIRCNKLKSFKQLKQPRHISIYVFKVSVLRSVHYLLLYAGYIQNLQLTIQEIKKNLKFRQIKTDWLVKMNYFLPDWTMHDGS